MNKFVSKYMFVLLMALSSMVCGGNLLTNGGFESPVIPSGLPYIENPVVSPWIISADYSAIFNESGLNGMTVAEGAQSLYLFNGYYRQNAGTFEADTIYELTFAASANNEAQYGLGWAAFDDGADGDFLRTSVGGKIITIDGSILKSAGKFYYGSLLLDTSEPAYSSLVGHSLNVVLHSAGMVHFDDVKLQAYVSAGANLLNNGGFESPLIDEGQGGVGTPDVSPWTVSAAYWHLYNSSGLGFPVAQGLQSLYLYGGSCQQVVGVIASDTVYGLDVSFAANDLGSGVYSYVELLAVGAGEPVRLGYVGLGDVIENPYQWYQASISFNSSAMPSAVGSDLVVKLYSGGLVHFDAVSVKVYPWDTGIGASPENGAALSYPFDSYLSQTVSLQWALPQSAVCDVYYGQNPANMAKIVDSQAVNTVDVNVLGLGICYWRVDVIDPSISDKPVRGRLMSFNADIYFPLGDGVNLLGNPSFETPVIAQGQSGMGTPDVAPWTVSAGYWHLYNSAGLGVSPAEGAQSLYVFGGACEQNAGVITAGNAYGLDVSVMANDLSSAGFSYIELLAVGSGDSIQLAIIGLGEVVKSPFNWYAVNLSFDTASNPAVIGKNIVVKLYSGGLMHFDNVSLVKIPSLNASPSSYISMDVPGSAELSWDLPAPAGASAVTCDVYLGQDLRYMTKIISNQPLNSINAGFTAYGKYYWIIGVRDAQINGGGPVYSPLMSFDVIDRCQGAKRLPGFTAMAADLNQDCEVNLLDMSIFANAWINN